jgi:hypothetical protein
MQRLMQTLGGQYSRASGKNAYAPDPFKEADMDVKSYCDTLERQLSAWKAKIYDVIHVVDKLPDGDKEKVFPSIRDLHAIVEEIDTQLEQLMTACPADWSPNRQTVDEKMAELQQTLKALSEKVGGPLIPDTLSWVSQ